MNDSVTSNTAANPHHGAEQVSSSIVNTRRNTLELFSAAWDRGDVNTLLSLMSDEPVYKGSTGNRPGTLYVGREQVRAAFERMVDGNADSSAPAHPATPPEMYFFSDRALVYWSLKLPGADGALNRVDGLDIIIFTDDGRIAVKDAYRKAFP